MQLKHTMIRIYLFMAIIGAVINFLSHKLSPDTLSSYPSYIQAIIIYTPVTLGLLLISGIILTVITMIAKLQLKISKQSTDALWSLTFAVITYTILIVITFLILTFLS